MNIYHVILSKSIFSWRIYALLEIFHRHYKDQEVFFTESSYPKLGSVIKKEHGIGRDSKTVS